MMVHLLQADGDFDLNTPLPLNEDELVQDLELSRIFEAMALGDQFLLSTSRQVFLSSLRKPSDIVFRQDVLRECIVHRQIIEKIYSTVIEALDGVDRVSFLGTSYFSRDNPEITLHRAARQLRFLTEMLKKLWQIAAENHHSFKSAGFTNFFAVIRDELDAQYFERVAARFKQLEFRDGVLLSVELGNGHKGKSHTLRERTNPRTSWKQRIASTLQRSKSNVVVISERDEGGLRALEELKGRGMNSAADAVAKSTDHILAYLKTLRFELAFYLGCVNLYAQLTQKEEPIAFPFPAEAGDAKLEATGLYDPSLSLRLNGRCVGNDVDAKGMAMIMVTGANQGGKSTFARSVGIAQLMMQAGMFVAASSFSADVRGGLFTDFKREEDATMGAGKLEEELVRMDKMIGRISPGCMAILNEPFSSTSEREGSEITRQLIAAMLESRVKLLVVTHFFDLAGSFFENNRPDVLFLRANRSEGELHSFRLAEGEPLGLAFGEDLYRQIFGVDP